MKFKNYLLNLLLLLIICQAEAQSDFPRVMNHQLNTYILQNIQEKLYLQTNSAQYCPGDTIWFKSSLVNAINHTPVAIEQLFYVDLISPGNKVISHRIFQLNNGLSQGYLSLPPQLLPGSYQLIAYTNYMRNYDPDFIYQKPIELIPANRQQIKWEFNSKVIPFAGGDSVDVRMVGRSANGRELNEPIDIRVQLAQGTMLGESCLITNNQGRFRFAVPDSLKLPTVLLSIQQTNKNSETERFRIKLSVQKPDLQFLPEGGQFVAGLENQLAFCCIDPDGHPLNVSGELLDEKNQPISSFTSEYQGMGTLTFVPQSNKHYHARINYQDSIFNYTLPEVEAEAYSLHFSGQDQDSLYMSIRSNRVEKANFMLLAHCRGITKYLASGILDTTSLALTIPKEEFPEGISVFTLFVNRAPRAERLVYLEKNEQLQFKLLNRPENFQKRSLTKLTIQVSNKAGEPVPGNYSLLAYDSGLEQSVDPLENIRNYLLFSSDLQGAVFRNTEAFNSKDPTANHKRDLFLLTHGWRRFQWTDVYMQTSNEKKYEMESSLYIDGEVRRILTGKTVPKNFEVSIILKNKEAFYIDKAYTNDEGKFRFYLPAFNDSAHLTIQTKNRTDNIRDYLISLHSNLENKQLNAHSFDRVQQSGFSPLVVNLNPIKSTGKENSLVTQKPLPVIKKPRIDNYYFPGKDTFMIEEVEARSKFMNNRDSMISQSGQPDVVIESAQLKKLTEERSWYGNLWDLLHDQVPGLQIDQRPYQKSQVKYYNLVIANPEEAMDTTRGEDDLGSQAIYFRVGENPDGLLYIFVDQDLLNSVNVPLYDFLSYMDPSEIESINFIAKPKNYDINKSFADNIQIDLFGTSNNNMSESLLSDIQTKLSQYDQLNRQIERISSPPAFLFITTKSKGGIFYKRAKGIQSLFLSGFTAKRKFYSPRYEKPEEQNNPLPDLRKTIFWQPELIADSSGIASASFYTGDSNTPLAIQVEGVSAKGESGSRTFIIEADNQAIQPEIPSLTAEQPTSPMKDSTNRYVALRLLSGQISDSESGNPLSFVDIFQANPYYHEHTNSNGEFFLAQDRLKSDQPIRISCPGYQSKTIPLPENKNAILQVKLKKETVQPVSSPVKALKIVRNAIRKSRSYYSSDESFQGYNRELVQINSDTYGIYESAFNYSNCGAAGNAGSLRFETVKFKNMEAKNGHKLLILKPNHRSLFYPLKADLLSLPPEFWQLEALNQFHFEIIGQQSYDGETCYKIRFEQNDRLVIPLQSGIVYIGQESAALRYAQWTSTPDKRKYISYTSYLQSNPLEYQVEVEDDFNEASYTFQNEKLYLQSTGQHIRILVNKQDKLSFDSNLSVVGKSLRDYHDIKNTNSDLLIEQEKAKHILVKEASYLLAPWVNQGIIKPEEKLINEAGFLHDITMFH